MNSVDMVTMLGNLSQSLLPVQHLIAGTAYLIGLLFFWEGISRLKKIGASAGSGSQEKMFVPLAYFLAGSALMFLPSAITVLSNTAFGAGNVLQYSTYNRFNIYNSMGIIIRTAGLIWFVRGAVLLSHASQPGVKEGSKGLVFLIAGVLAINFENTMGMFNTALEQFFSTTLAVKSARGY